MITVDIRINTSAIEKKLEKSAAAATFITTQQALKDCNQYCPEDQGGLIASSITYSEPDKGIMRWKGPQARMLYYGIVMVDPKTGKACFWIGDQPYSRKGVKKVKSNPVREFKFGNGRRKLWAKYAQSKHGKDWRDVFQAAMRASAGKE